MALASLQHSLFPDVGPQTGARFGGAVAADTNLLVVSARYSDVAGHSDVGQAIVYSATTGSIVSTLYNPNPANGDQFGASVAVSGNIVVVGAPQQNIGATDSGAAYVFNATTGALIAMLNNPSPSNLDEFGSSVAVSGDFVVVGASGEDALATNAGTAYVFNATTGVLITTLNNPTPASDDRFGASVSLSDNIVAVGAPGDNTGASDAGSAYVFGATSGTLFGTINNPTPASSDFFGSCVSVSSNLVLVGAFADDVGATNSGSAYVFNTTTGTLVATLNNPAPEASDHFGFSVSVSNTIAVVGTYGDNSGATDSGAAYSFDATTGALVATINNPTPSIGDEFGYAVAVSGDVALIGAWLGSV